MQSVNSTAPADRATLNDKPLKVIEHFTDLGRNISTTASNVNIGIGEVWTAINILLTIRKSNLSDKMKQEFDQAVAMSELLYGCTIWTLMKRSKKMIDWSSTMILHIILYKSWEQQTTKQLVFNYLPPISQTSQERLTRLSKDCWRNMGKLMSEVLLWTHGCWPTSKHLYSSILCGHSMPSRRPGKGNGLLRLMVWESQGNLCHQHDLMMMFKKYCTHTHTHIYISAAHWPWELSVPRSSHTKD